MSNQPVDNEFYIQIIDLLQSAKKTVIRTVNSAMVQVYFEIGKMIVEEEQEGDSRAKYGESLLKGLSKALTKEFGKGFSQRNVEQMRKFYLTYSKTQTLPADFNLSWSHYLTLMRIDDINERSFYEIESAKNNWSVRELQRQYDSALYTRLALSRDKDKLKELSEKGLILQEPKDAIKVCPSRHVS